jgi:hypothetical protein
MSRLGRIASIAAAGSIGLGLVLMALPHMPLPAGHAASETPDALVVKLAAGSGTRPPEPDYSAISKRPLFVAGRRMPPPVPEPVAATAPTSAPLPSLIGIMIEPDKRMAVVKRVNDAKILSLTEGQSIDGWLLKDVENTKVTLQSGSTQQTLALPEIGKR